MGDPFVTAGYVLTYGALALYALSLVIRWRCSDRSDKA